MAIENLKENLGMERALLGEIIIFSSQSKSLESMYPYERKDLEKRLLRKAIISAVERMRILNDSIPGILETISPFKKLTEKPEKAEGLVKISYIGEEKKKVAVTIEKKSRDKFLKELTISTAALRRIKRKDWKKKEIEFVEFKKANFYAKTSNKLFLNFSNKLLNKGKLVRLNSYLRKANMPFLVSTYFSMALLTGLLALILGVIVFAVLIFALNFNFINILRNLLIPIMLPIITFISFYFYPYLEGRSVESKINQELPFVAINMSAIASSNIEPTQIFKIVALGEEYKYTKKEMKKIINQVNVYGYDLITALKNTARETSSKKLSELLNGMATTISSGGSLSEFLNKRAETLLFDYRMDREKYTKSAETFMDIYISIVIAAPMIMTLLLVLIAVSNIGLGMSLQALTVLIISIVALINILFLVFLHLSQPSY